MECYNLVYDLVYKKENYIWNAIFQYMIQYTKKRIIYEIL